jgi:hypothetical protein
MSSHRSEETTEAVKDPVCGMTVDPEKAAESIDLQARPSISAAAGAPQSSGRIQKNISRPTSRSRICIASRVL